jgi:uncharacterized membrane protein
MFTEGKTELGVYLVASGMYLFYATYFGKVSAHTGSVQKKFLLGSIIEFLLWTFLYGIILYGPYWVYQHEMLFPLN